MNLIWRENTPCKSRTYVLEVIKHIILYEDASRILFNEEIKQAIVKNGVIEALDASVKDGNMEGAWKIEDLYEFASMINSVWPRNWRKNTELDAETVVVFDLVEALECNMRGHDESKMKTCADYCKVWKLLTSDKLKAIQFAGYGRCITSTIIEL